VASVPARSDRLLLAISIAEDKDTSSPK